MIGWRMGVGMDIWIPLFAFLVAIGVLMGLKVLSPKGG